MTATDPESNKGASSAASSSGAESQREASTSAAGYQRLAEMAQKAYDAMDDGPRVVHAVPGAIERRAEEDRATIAAFAEAYCAPAVILELLAERDSLLARLTTAETELARRERSFHALLEVAGTEAGLLRRVESLESDYLSVQSLAAAVATERDEWKAAAAGDQCPYCERMLRAEARVEAAEREQDELRAGMRVNAESYLAELKLRVAAEKERDEAIAALKDEMQWDMGGHTESSLPWRVGRKVHRTIYAQFGPEPTDNDKLIGLMDTAAAASCAVEAHNDSLARAALACPPQQADGAMVEGA